ncbi:hypothetical protein M885DRAFT_507711 [Pelagophyceae sp. CCMP2097]|nr:hypothetical protein M885DRAFT_507711 [Pelagophyceae sp. CCMP2097]|mmetsp:Transcript_27286/g.91712  ORF Transcript_27286/g.91712 Transcript_27286/m.91712 type:complete len:307 (+) Transcript_27286:79-999(+)
MPVESVAFEPALERLLLSVSELPAELRRDKVLRAVTSLIDLEDNTTDDIDDAEEDDRPAKRRKSLLDVVAKRCKAACDRHDASMQMDDAKGEDAQARCTKFASEALSALAGGSKARPAVDDGAAADDEHETDDAADRKARRPPSVGRPSDASGPPPGSDDCEDEGLEAPQLNGPTRAPRTTHRAFTPTDDRFLVAAIIEAHRGVNKAHKPRPKWSAIYATAAAAPLRAARQTPCTEKDLQYRYQHGFQTKQGGIRGCVTQLSEALANKYPPNGVGPSHADIIKSINLRKALVDGDVLEHHNSANAN